jgi:hypothetical protein
VTNRSSDVGRAPTRDNHRTARAAMDTDAVRLHGGTAREIVFVDPGLSDTATLLGGVKPGVDTIDGGAGDDTIKLVNSTFAPGGSIQGGTGTDILYMLYMVNAGTYDFTAGTLSGVETLYDYAGGSITATMTASQWAGFSTINLYYSGYYGVSTLTSLAAPATTH